MATPTITIELPEELITLLGSPDETSKRVRAFLVLDLLRSGEISQGKAAELLGLSRWEMHDLVVEHEMPSGPQTADDMRKEIEVIRRIVQQR